VNKFFLVSGNAGQGKTTVAKNIALSLRQFGFDVLLVDADLFSPKLGHYLGIPLVERTIQGVLLGYYSLKDALYVHSSGLKLLLSSLSEFDVPHPSVLFEDLKNLADIVIVDVPSRDKEWFKSGADILFVTLPDFPSVLDCKKVCRFLNVKGVIVNRFHGDSFDLSPGNIFEIVNVPLIGFVPYESRIREALKYGFSIVDFHPEFKASIILKQIAAKLMNLEYSSSFRKPLLEKIGLL